MDLAQPLTALLRPLDAEVFTVLAAASRPLTIGDVARGAPSYGRDRIKGALVRLAQRGVVTRDPARPATLFSVNRDHLVTRSLLELSCATKMLRQLFTSALEEILDIRLAAVQFTPGHQSPIELLIVRADGVPETAIAKRLSWVVDRAGRLSGNPVRIRLTTQAALEADRSSDIAFLRDATLLIAEAHLMDRLTSAQQ